MSLISRTRAFIGDALCFHRIHNGSGAELNIRKLQIKSQWHHFQEWRRTLSDKSPFSNRQPWMTFDAIYYLRSNLRSHFVVFEWGSGGSTLFFRECCKSVITVEHDIDFAHIMEPLLNQEFASDLHQYIVAPPTDNDEEVEGCKSLMIPGSFANYVRSIDNYDDQSFDVISVDGRSRNSCINAAIGKLRNGGLLIIDNSERLQYSKGLECVPQSWKRLSFPGCGPYNRYFWETTVFVKQ
jgi:hypothetical protein